MKNRLRILGKSLKLSQKDFGEKIGITESAICNYENGSRPLTDQIILSICREYGANREWLIYGTGEMLSDLPESLLDELAVQFQLTEDEKAFIHDFCTLSKEHRKIVLNFMRNI